MNRKILTIVCFAMLIGSYFMYKYQGEQRTKAIIEREEAAEKEHKDSMKIIESYKPFNSILEKEMSEFVTTSKAKEAAEKGARKLYFITFGKGSKGDYLQVNTGYGFDKSKIKGYTRFNGEIFIYYGNPDGVDQNLINESQLLKSFDELEFYAEQKPQKDTKPLSQQYIILDKDSLVTIK